MIPAGLILLGALTGFGFARLAWPVAAGLKALGFEPTETALWRRLRQTFPGIGREFMPPLDEGSLLFMPSLLPAASLTQAQEVIARQDRATQQVPEVASVVGKLGRAESALDPAPIGMVETILLLKPENQWRLVHQIRWHSDVPWLDWVRPVLVALWPEQRRITKAEILAELQARTAMPGVLPSPSRHGSSCSKPASGP